MNAILKTAGLLILAANFIPVWADNAPNVTTDTRFARGATCAYGRAKFAAVNGNTIQTRGFCWSSENRNPTIEDSHSNQTYSNNGLIFRMEGLTPAAIYYARAYAVGKDGSVGYGDVIKIVTLPMGTITWEYDNGADAAANGRINAAVESCVTYWNKLTSIPDLHLNVHYGSGTPTADCSYGGWMRVGPNSSYQRTGTIMHEALHAIGVGQHDLWYGSSSPLRGGSGTGRWLGERTTELMRFWDNSTTEYPTGDATHIWATGGSNMTSFSVNGAQEDTGTDMQYTAVSLLAQAVGEDGLPPTYTRAFGLAYYAFDQEDTIKYYIKNESEAYGLFSSFLTETSDHKLQWQKMTAAEAVANDAAAWYITFTPNNQYYQFRNAQSGYRISYSSNGFITASSPTVSSNQNFQLMRSRKDITDINGNTLAVSRGYWMLYPDNYDDTPPALTASANGAVGKSDFDISDNAAQQRWVILTEAESVEMDDAGLKSVQALYRKNRSLVDGLFATPHYQIEKDADNVLTSKLSAWQSQFEASSSASDINDLADSVLLAGKNWLGKVCVLDTLTPFDLTPFLTNPGFDTDLSGWSITTGTWGQSAVEFYEVAQSCKQGIPNMPKGTYSVKVQGFQRPGGYSDVYTSYTAGTDNANTRLYIGNYTTYKKIRNLMADRSETSLHADDRKMADGTWIPNTMSSAAAHFAAGYYENEYRQFRSSAGTVYIGIMGNTGTAYWTMIDNFRLYYYGPMKLTDWATGLEEVQISSEASTDTYYDLMGRQVTQPAKGIFIRNGKKVILR
jgi:hypothetical protein